MKYLLFFFLGATCVLIFVTSAFLIYEQNQTLQSYKRAFLGSRDEYNTLQKEYADYIKHTKNLRKVIIVSDPKTAQYNKIETAVQQNIKDIDGDISIYYKNLSTGETFMVDPEKPYYMASLYKVILTLYTLEEVKNGTMQLSDLVGSTNTTVEKALNKIITESDNEYAQILATTFGWKKIEIAMKDQLHIDFSFNQDLQTSAKTIGILFEKIALSLNIPDWESKYLLDLLNDQKKISKLPKYLPKNIYSHNKTGEFEEYSHDAGIFYTPKANYILVVMTKTKIPGQTNEAMALLSKDIYALLNEESTISN